MSFGDRKAEPDEVPEAQAPGSALARGLGAVLARVRDVALPPLCAACSAPLAGADSLCGACWRRVDFIRPPLCDRLGIPLPYALGEGPELSAAAVAAPPVYGRARAVARFDGVIRDLVHGFKYADRHDARRLFGRWLAGAGAELLAGADLLIPVPLARWRLFNRRYNQAAILAAEVSRICGVPSEAMALRRVRSTPSQVGLTPDQRRRNVAGAFRVAPRQAGRIAGCSIVLVDDVITTGATLDACARALLGAGAVRVDALALALATEHGRRT